MLSKSEQGKRSNSEAIANEINKLDEINYHTVSKLLPRLLQQKSLVLDHTVYLPAASLPNRYGVGRHLVYEHNDETNPFSIWVFAFGPGQKTCIHDHKYQGTVIILDGPVAEKSYIPTGENTARIAARSNRYSFHCNSDDLNDAFVHRLKRREKMDDGRKLGEGISVTLHIYDMPAFSFDLDGNKVDSRNLNKIYSKDKSFGKSDVPYTDEYPDIEERSLQFI